MKLKRGQGKETKTCEICGALFTALICNKRRFCTLACAIKGKHINRNQKEYHCKTCGKSVVRSDCHVMGNVFCSRECSATFQRNKPGPGGRERDPSKRKIVTCKMCGETFERFASAIVSKDTFCSRSCSSKHTNKFRRGNRSKLEKWLIPRLTKSEYPVLFNNRKVLNGYELDIYFPTKKLAFEIDGPWHTKAFNGLDHLTQIQTNDKIKEDKCNQLGITLIRIPNMSTFTEHVGSEILNQITESLKHLNAKTLNR